MELSDILKTCEIPFSEPFLASFFRNYIFRKISLLLMYVCAFMCREQNGWSGAMPQEVNGLQKYLVTAKCKNKGTNILL